MQRYKRLPVPLCLRIPIISGPLLSPTMSTHPRPDFEKRAMGGDDCAQRKSDLAREFKHTKAGIWDVYEQIPPAKFGINIPGVSKLSQNLEIIEDLPFVWRMVKDVTKIKSCWYYLCLFIFVKALASLEPAVALWCVILRVIYVCGLPNVQRPGSPATTSPLFAFIRTPLASPNHNYRFKWLWTNGA